MKRQISVLVFSLMTTAILLFGCVNDEIGGDVTEATGNYVNSGESIKAVPFVDIQSSWAWVITNEGFEKPANQMVALEYSSPEKLKDLTLASGSNSLISVEYAGNKMATGNNGDYNPTFVGVPGPTWRISKGSFPVRQYSYVLLPESCQSGVLNLTPATAPFKEAHFDNHNHPVAEPEDVAKIEALKNGRKIMNSELLTTDSKGGRVSLFQFTNTDYGLLILAYIRNDKVITKEFTANVYDGTATWRADAEDDDICVFEVQLLCETDAGMVIGFSWDGPEGTRRFLLVENTGKFTDFISSAWYYDHWANVDNEFTHITYDLFNAELWPESD